jgi:hypothetical protein
VEESLEKIKPEVDKDLNHIGFEKKLNLGGANSKQKLVFERGTALGNWDIYSEEWAGPHCWLDDNTINLKIRCYRPCSIISRQPSISVLVYPASGNQLFLNRLKVELEKSGLTYEVKEYDFPF